MFPHEARIRNLTYATEIYVDARLVKLQQEPVEKTGLKNQVKQEAKFKVLQEYDKINVFLGRVPVMVRSKFCHLKSLEDHEIIRNAKECTFD